MSLEGWAIKWYLGRENMDKIKAAAAAVIGFGEGHRTQIGCALLALAQLLHVAHVLTADQVGQISSVLVPLTGAAFAAKLQRHASVISDLLDDSEDTSSAKPAPPAQ